jgi:protein gp37
MACRLKAMGANGYENGFKLSLMPSRIEQPLKRKKPTMYFVNSMSDLFHEDIPFSYIDQVINVIRQTPHHTYQMLTKRADIMSKYFADKDIPQNIWLGVTVEDKAYGVPRIDELRKVNAHIRFLSVEPLLEDIGSIDLTGIHWVIVGGESGAKARPMRPEWATNIRHQCEKQGAAFFFKQWGTWGADGIKRSKHLNGRELDGNTWDNYPNLYAA